MPQRKEKGKEILRTRKTTKSISVLSPLDKGLSKRKSSGKHLHGKINRFYSIKMINLYPLKTLKTKLKINNQPRKLFQQI